MWYMVDEIIAMVKRLGMMSCQLARQMVGGGRLWAMFAKAYFFEAGSGGGFEAGDSRQGRLAWYACKWILGEWWSFHFGQHPQNSMRRLWGVC